MIRSVLNHIGVRFPLVKQYGDEKKAATRKNCSTMPY